MSNDGSLGETQFPFDIETQKGVMLLLAAVRASDLPQAQKNEIRDLAFLYTNGGRDQSVRITLQQKVVVAGLQPVAAPAIVIPPVVPPPVFGSSRPAPFFPTAVTTPPPPVAPPSVAAPVTVVAPEVPVAPAVPPVQPVPIPVAVPVPPVATPSPADYIVTPAVVPTIVPPPQEVVMPVAAAPVTSAFPVAPAPVPVTEFSSPAVAPAYDAEAAAQRIREIKAIVNEKVGNPVNLVDINNEVGREYMAALLDAMKKIGSGTSVVSAMKRLEAAFVMVQETLRVREQMQSVSMAALVSAAPAAPAAVSPSVVQVGQPPVMEVLPVVLPAEPTPIPVEPPAAVFEPVISAPAETVFPPEPVSPHVVEPVSQSDFSIGQPVEHIQSEEYPVPTAPFDVQPAVPAGAPASVPIKRVEGGIDTAWGPATDTIVPPASRSIHLASLAESDERLRTPSELPSAADIATSSVGGDPLFTKDVDDGLQQLLSEWSLFKKSGLFGSGPKGREHPLFKKISGLQIPLLLAGRFEGATQEIKQSITDYMNGWRYEQGIIYEQGETFEHYLRRVIHHIIDLQRKRHNP